MHYTLNSAIVAFLPLFLAIIDEAYKFAMEHSAIFYCHHKSQAHTYLGL